MSIEANSRAAQELQMMQGLVDCAHALGIALGQSARTEGDLTTRLKLADAFLRASQAVRLGIRLSLALRAAPRVAPAGAAAPMTEARLGGEPPEVDPSEHEPPERDDRLEYERERDYEPVSLAKFLSTLGVVAHRAAALRDRLPAEAAATLPALRELLAQAKTEAAPIAPAVAPAATAPARASLGGVAVLARPSNARAALFGSASVRLSPVRGPTLPRPPPRGPG